MEEVYLNGDLEQGAPNILSVASAMLKASRGYGAERHGGFLRFSLYFREP